MCGIGGYIGEKTNGKILFDMLKRLEYRGYDSAGIAYISVDGKILFAKDKGKINELEKKVNLEKIYFSVGIAHTRWATHGVPSKENAHPHFDCKKNFALVHNGIIENYKNLREMLKQKGHNFSSETDTEIIAHLIEEFYKEEKNFETAFVKAMKEIKGSFAIAAISTFENDKILIARNESPLIVGLANGENFIASDIPAILPKTKRIIILDDFEYGVVTKDSIKIMSIWNRSEIKKQIHEVKWKIEDAEKSGYEHFMLKEIHEGPTAVKNALREKEKIWEIAKKISNKKRIYFIGCGTAWHAALAGKYLLERFGIFSDAVVGSEFRYSTVNTIDEDCAVIAISQSGETTDTIASVREAKKRGAFIVSIVNVLGSTLTRISDENIFIHSGPEIAVASTKAYIGQLTSITLLSLEIARENKKIDSETLEKNLNEFEELPKKIEEILNEKEKIKKLAEKFYKKRIFFYIGRRLGYGTALEGALKIKEISYVHAEAYPAGEMKHGPIALLDEGVPVIAISPINELNEKMESNIQEAKARKASVIVISEKNGSDIEIPKVNPLLSPILYIVPLHLFAYYISTLKGLDPDKPRNLAKSVTVE
ncbi:MAG: glutamine--fructose-6-phosphate transaminase (isomerizing) [Candidatus Altiarchaeota archaeon]